MISDVVAWLSSLLWLIAIFGMWWTCMRQYERICSLEQLIRNVYEKSHAPDQPHTSNTYVQLLTNLGWKQATFETRRDILSYLRAEAQADKQKLATYIEMMPQMGLLGTVLSLFLSAFFFDFNMKMLGMALATTAFGLIGSLIARNWFELPSERHFYRIMAMLQDEQITQELLDLHEHHTTSPPSETSESTSHPELPETLAAVPVSPQTTDPMTVVDLSAPVNLLGSKPDAPATPSPSEIIDIPGSVRPIPAQPVSSESIASDRESLSHNTTVASSNTGSSDVITSSESAISSTTENKSHDDSETGDNKGAGKHASLQD